MNEQTQNVMLYAAFAALGYALWTRFSPAKQTPAALAAQQTGASYNPANPGAFESIASLINGTVHDIYVGDTSSYNTPTTTQIFNNVTGYDPKTNYFASMQDRGYLA